MLILVLDPVSGIGTSSITAMDAMFNAYQGKRITYERPLYFSACIVKILVDKYKKA